MADKVVHFDVDDYLGWTQEQQDELDYALSDEAILQDIEQEILEGGKSIHDLQQEAQTRLHNDEGYQMRLEEQILENQKRGKNIDELAHNLQDLNIRIKQINKQMEDLDKISLDISQLREAMRRSPERIMDPETGEISFEQTRNFLGNSLGLTTTEDAARFNGIISSLNRDGFMRLTREVSAGPNRLANIAEAARITLSRFAANAKDAIENKLRPVRDNLVFAANTVRHAIVDNVRTIKTGLDRAGSDFKLKAAKLLSGQALRESASVLKKKAMDHIIHPIGVTHDIVHLEHQKARKAREIIHEQNIMNKHASKINELSRKIQDARKKEVEKQTEIFDKNIQERNDKFEQDIQDLTKQLTNGEITSEEYTQKMSALTDEHKRDIDTLKLQKAEALRKANELQPPELADKTNGHIVDMAKNAKDLDSMLHEAQNLTDQQKEKLKSEYLHLSDETEEKKFFDKHIKSHVVPNTVTYEMFKTFLRRPDEEKDQTREGLTKAVNELYADKTLSGTYRKQMVNTVNLMYNLGFSDKEVADIIKENHDPTRISQDAIYTYLKKASAQVFEDNIQNNTETPKEAAEEKTVIDMAEKIDPQPTVTEKDVEEVKKTPMRENVEAEVQNVSVEDKIIQSFKTPQEQAVAKVALGWATASLDTKDGDYKIYDNKTHEELVAFEGKIEGSSAIAANMNEGKQAFDKMYEKISKEVEEKRPEFEKEVEQEKAQDSQRMNQTVEAVRTTLKEQYDKGALSLAEYMQADVSSAAAAHMPANDPTPQQRAVDILNTLQEKEKAVNRNELQNAISDTEHAIDEARKQESFEYTRAASFKNQNLQQQLQNGTISKEEFQAQQSALQDATRELRHQTALNGAEEKYEAQTQILKNLKVPRHVKDSTYMSKNDIQAYLESARTEYEKETQEINQKFDEEKAADIAKRSEQTKTEEQAQEESAPNEPVKNKNQNIDHTDGDDGNGSSNAAAAQAQEENNGYDEYDPIDDR